MTQFDWSDYLTLAKALLESPPREALLQAVWRTAISRAYYASFCAARAFYVAKHGHQFRDESVHTEVRRSYREMGNRMNSHRYKKIADALDRLHAARSKADYDSTMEDPGQAADIAVRRSEEILKLLSSMQR